MIVEIFVRSHFNGVFPLLYHPRQSYFDQCLPFPWSAGPAGTALAVALPSITEGDREWLSRAAGPAAVVQSAGACRAARDPGLQCLQRHAEVSSRTARALALPFAQVLAASVLEPTHTEPASARWRARRVRGQDRTRMERRDAGVLPRPELRALSACSVGLKSTALSTSPGPAPRAYM